MCGVQRTVFVSAQSLRPYDQVREPPQSTQKTVTGPRAPQLQRLNLAQRSTHQVEPASNPVRSPLVLLVSAAPDPGPAEKAMRLGSCISGNPL